MNGAHLSSARWRTRAAKAGHTHAGHMPTAMLTRKLDTAIKDSVCEWTLATAARLTENLRCSTRSNESGQAVHTHTRAFVTRSIIPYPPQNRSLRSLYSVNCTQQLPCPVAHGHPQEFFPRVGKLWVWNESLPVGSSMKTRL